MHIKEINIKNQAYKFLDNLLKDTLKPFGNYKNKLQKCMKQCFSICKSMYILKVYSVHFTLR